MILLLLQAGMGQAAEFVPDEDFALHTLLNLLATAEARIDRTSASLSTQALAEITLLDAPAFLDGASEANAGALLQLVPNGTERFGQCVQVQYTYSNILSSSAQGVELQASASLGTEPLRFQGQVLAQTATAIPAGGTLRTGLTDTIDYYNTEGQCRIAFMGPGDINATDQSELTMSESFVARIGDRIRISIGSAAFVGGRGTGQSSAASTTSLLMEIVSAEAFSCSAPPPCNIPPVVPVANRWLLGIMALLLACAAAASLVGRRDRFS